ncbi:unnamed protein product [Diatraea saccharalis]|uniref:N-acetylneuraminate lyase n=1 Tax=Diatraea saccharalis TaxID=40085 RepID=A0A9N9R4K1_9NEOP|nr:unnamed protein product [Diatraea saccharalis]
MYSNSYRWCLVTSCTNTTIRTPNKLFIQVPDDAVLRDVWLELAKRDPKSLSSKSRLYLCEDHFNLEQDMQNYMEYKIMGSVKKVKMKSNVVPTKFNFNSEKRQKLSPSSTRSTLKKPKRPYSIRRVRREPTVLPSKSDVPTLQTGEDKANLAIKLHMLFPYKSIQGSRYFYTKQEDEDEPSSSQANSINITSTFSDDSTLSTNSLCKQEDDFDPINTTSEQNDPLRIVHVSSEVEFKARGLVPPVFTPLHSDGSINFPAISSYAQYLVDAGIKAVLVGGTTGENMSMRVVDRMKLIDEWVEASQSTGLHIMVQVGGAPLADVLLLAKYCANTGVHSLLTLPELYFKPQSVDELVSYVQLVAEAAPTLPVLYYHIPSMSKVEINMPQFVTAATARIPNFKGLKFTSNDLSEASQVLRSLQEGQEIFLGADTLLAPAALLGIKSSIGTTFNLFPALAQQILQAVESNDVLLARNLQEKLSLAIEAHTCEGAWVPIMKAGMEIVTGINVGPPALPQRPISAEAKARIAEKLTELGVADVKWLTS